VINADHVLGTVPQVTIPPINRGLMGQLANCGCYFTSYGRVRDTDDSFDPAVEPHLTAKSPGSRHHHQYGQLSFTPSEERAQHATDHSALNASRPAGTPPPKPRPRERIPRETANRLTTRVTHPHRTP
jgi:hypothetical protein